MKENRLETALAELSTAERDEPGDPRIRNFRGIALAGLGQGAEAAVEYREAVRLDPKMEDAYRNLGFLEWTAHHLDPARVALAQAVELVHEDSFAHYYLGRVQLDQQSYAEAFRELQLSDVPWPAEPSFLMQVATGHLKLGQQGEARETLRHLAALPLQDAETVRVTALLLAVHDNDGALNVMHKLVDPQPAKSVPWAHFDLALASLMAGKYQKAVDQTQSYMDAQHLEGSRSTQAALASSLIGIAYARLGQDDQAVKALRNAATLAPDQEIHWLNLTRELMELSRYVETISAVQDGLTANPKSYALHLRLGAAYLSAGRYADAETIFRDLVVAGDPLPLSDIGLAQALLRTGRAPEAASELAAAQDRLGETFLVSYFQGLSLDRAGQREQAVVLFSKAIRLNPNSAEAHLELGKAELALGQVKDGIAALDEALRLSPGNIQARRLLSRAYQRIGDAKRAVQLAETAPETQSAPQDDLLGDFVLPDWQMPDESIKVDGSVTKGSL